MTFSGLLSVPRALLLSLFLSLSLSLTQNTPIPLPSKRTKKQSHKKTKQNQSSVVDVMGLMVENNIRHVPVVEGGSFLGMVSIRDVVTTMLEEHREEVGRLHEYISGSY